jgi:hypothetical protein
MSAAPTPAWHVSRDLAPALQAVVFDSPTRFSFAGGQPIDVANLPPPVCPPGHPIHPLPDHPLVRTIQAVLYRRCYSHRLAVPEPPPFDSIAPDPDLLGRLAAANHSVTRWDGAWRVYRTGADGALFVLKGETQRSAHAGEHAHEDARLAGTPPVAGAFVSLYMPRESYTLQPGFYFMFGETPGTLWDEHFTVRFYFNASADSVSGLVRYVTRQLNRYEVPYRMKALTDPPSYARVDPMVLYVARRYVQIVHGIVDAMPQETADLLSSATPLFTRPVRPGVGIAEDPGTGESFGMHRCRLTAEGLVDAFLNGRHGLPDRMQAVARRFAHNGLRFDRPHLNAGSTEPIDEADGMNGGGEG